MLNIDLPARVEPIIRRAGEILLSFYGKNLTWHDKKDQGFATEADLASEKFLIEELGKVLPEASFFAEESGSQGSDNAEYCWVIDPLDGTTNFAYGIPYFCISIALTKNKKPVFGIIYVPISDELFVAQKDQGATLNGKPISVAKTRPLARSLLLVGFPYAKSKPFLSVLSSLEEITPRSYAFRHLGSAAIDQAYIAAGKADGLFFENLGWWDVAAGLLLIQEANGIVTTYEGGPVTPSYKTYIAGNPELHAKLLSYLND